MVGHIPLEDVILVRIQVPQQVKKNQFRALGIKLVIVLNSELSRA